MKTAVYIIAGGCCIIRLTDKLDFVGEQMTKHIANMLTAGRILGSILLLFFPAFSAIQEGLCVIADGAYT